MRFETLRSFCSNWFQRPPHFILVPFSLFLVPIVFPMIPRRRFLALLLIAPLLLILGSSCTSITSSETGLLPGARRVVFLGDSITFAGGYACDVESYFITRDPSRKIEFISVGLSSETVCGLTEEGYAGGKFPRPDVHDRLAGMLSQIKPDLVFACYGMNDGIYQPLDEGRFEKFREGMKWLHAEVEKAGVKIIHLTPPPYDSKRSKLSFYNGVLDAYSDWMLTQRKAGWVVFDLHGAMNHYLEVRRATEPDFFLAKDTIHPGDLGHWLMAKEILLNLGAKDIAAAPDSTAMLAAHPQGAKIRELVRQRQTLLRNAWLTALGIKRPGLAKGLPLDQAQAKAKELEIQIQALALPAK